MIGGAGHVGLPLAMMFADAGLRTVIYDINPEAVAMVRKGIMPFARTAGKRSCERSSRAGRLEVESARLKSSLIAGTWSLSSARRSTSI